MDWNIIKDAGGYAVGIAGIVVAYRANRKRDKDMMMKAYIDKAVEPLAKADVVATIEERTRHLVTKEEFVDLVAKVDRLLKRNDA